MRKKVISYVLIAVGGLPILTAIMMVTQGMVRALFSLFFGLGTGIIVTFVGIGFFVSLLFGVYLLKKE